MTNPNAEELLNLADTLNDAGEQAEAIKIYQQVIEITPTWSVPYFNLGLLYKYSGDWEQSLCYNQKVIDLEPEQEAAWWNTGVAATALKKWRIARQAWNRFGLNYEINDDDPAGYLSRCPIRLDPDHSGEVVWAKRIDPARAVIENIPFAATGHRFGDAVLNDGAPIGYRVNGGVEYPVLNGLQLLQTSGVHTWSVRIKDCEQTDIDKLIQLCKEASIEVEDWTTVRFLCRKCSEGVVHEEHDEDLNTSDTDERHVAFASEYREPLHQLLLKWKRLVGHECSELVLELE